LSTASPPLAESTDKAIDFTIGHEFNQLRDIVTRYIVEQESAANSRPLGLHRGYQHLQGVLVPEMLDRVIAYCLDLEIRDADLITLKIRTAFEPQLKAVGQSLGLSFQSPSTGMTARVISDFKRWVDAYCAANIASRVHAAVERRRHMDPPRDAPPEPPQKNDPVGVTYHITGPTQINNNSPAATQNNTQPPSPRKERSKTFPWVKLVVWVLVVGGLGIAGLVLKYRHESTPVSTPGPAADLVLPLLPPVTDDKEQIPPPSETTPKIPSVDRHHRVTPPSPTESAGQREPPLGPKGRLMLRVVDSQKKPLQASCVVGGVAVLPPYEATLPVGLVRATCRFEDYDDGFAEGTVKAGESTMLTVELKGALGALTVKLEDADGNLIGGKCSLDGDPFDIAANGSTTRMRLPARRMRLDCTADGYEKGGGDIPIEGEVFKTATLKLRKLPRQ
jgi:hypothetical protein